MMAGSKRFGTRFLWVFCLCFTQALLYPSEGQENLEGKIIKEIQFEGLKRTKEYIVARELISKVGEPMRQDILNKEFNRLLSLDISMRKKPIGQAHIQR